ncbi:MAG TPA: putative DNA modification/repair radical SAM protein [Selenomonadales bacterium]|nr:putative DNA modification/repair radical SAM protein [Selenomonadales bacterium]
MDLSDKLKLLGEGAKYDICASTATRSAKVKNAAIGNTLPSGCCHSFTPDGRCVSLFKVLMTNYCEKDCAYCPNQAGRDVPRTRFEAEELARLFMDFYRRNYVEGLFLSSGVRHSTAATMADMLRVAELLRSRYRFGGYIHLKILPGASDAEIEAAANLADRLSLNMEAPTAGHLAKLSRTKKFGSEILGSMAKIGAHLRAQRGVTHTTQYIVGAAAESDRDILSSTDTLYKAYGLKRAYFSAFQPVAKTPLDHLPATPLLRENRLYQSDFLMRLYGFALSDLVFNPAGALDLELDPKLAYALHHPELFPLEINCASYASLLRVPGIGPQSAARIVAVRRSHRFAEYAELKNAGVVLKRALSFITVNGRYYGQRRFLTRPERRVFQQLSLWGDDRDLVFADAGGHR